ncbi:16S rRNA (adenine(1518)-N(6)/adenine(1519)-N(6))-dimethyltransferase RsmA [Caldinitratiruptor microaerophilus]|uniref:Ribosomal RNA small subunit methyltransferase A n=1 Tax=Caldinitratiruptor microaerophilus TaxID=671077 RepID=A0AA35CQA8_9FIRM|nr:16S rRNA (adenine(1518)-N(6)/adenine(1519)-N(6))-dimethyltransferase RsmA [Caldinitratiruptor microaerophilus]BDG61991.1 ribosomal RNA small subunit methyltransferase A [Caldinitratiruptor microaerophilus]
MEQFDPASVRSIRAWLEARGLRPRRGLGQHFLVDRRVVDRIVAAVEPAPGDLVLEIGPGPGILTRALVEAGARVVAVELDRQLAALLRDTLPAAGAPGTVEVVEGDALKVDLAGLLAARLRPGARARVAANLPYYITSPLLFRLLEEDLPLERIVVMVQREVADRILAPPGTRAYAALSVAVAYHAEARLVARVPPGAFWPPPSVDSAVVLLRLRERPPVATPREALFRVVRAAFGQRRKTLLRALAGGLRLDGDVVARALARAGVDGTRRGETLSLAEFAAVADALAGTGGHTG